MDLRDFVAWALDPKRSDDEAFFAELVTESGYSAWCSKHIPGYYRDWREASEKHRERRLNPAHRVQLEPSEVAHAAEMLAGAEYLSLGNYQDRPVRDLAGLQFFPQLRRLSIERSEIQDLAPLTALVNLEELNLRDDVVEDLRPVGALRKLRQLWVHVREPWPLVDNWNALTELEFLWWDGNLLVLEGLGPFPKMREAHLGTYLTQVPARDATRLPAMPALKFLHLDGLRRLDGIERWPQVLNLEVEGKFRDLTPLTALTQVTHLHVNTDAPLDLAVLCRMPVLRSFKLTSLQPQEFFALTESPQLHEVGASRCEANDREVATLQEVLPSWDADFLLATPRSLPALEFVVCEQTEWERRCGDSAHAADWDGNRAMQASESAWLERRAQAALDKLFGGMTWGKVEYATVRVIWVEAAERLPEIVAVLRQVLAACRHPHRLTINVDLKALTLPKKPAPPESEEKRLKRERTERKETEARWQEEAELRERDHRLRQLRQEGVKVNPEEFAPSPPPLEVEELDADNAVYDDDEGEPHLLVDDYHLYAAVYEEGVTVHVHHVAVAERLLRQPAKRLE